MNKPRPSGAVSVVGLKGVIRGRNSKLFKKYPDKDKEDESFSIEFPKRTLDLELVRENDVARDIWIEAFRMLIDKKFKKDQVQRYVSEKMTMV